MTLPTKNWQLPPRDARTIEEVKALQEAGVNHSPAFLRLCLSRGLNSAQKIEEATNTQPQLFHDPFDLYDMQVLVDRLQAAIENQEHILIYGDYDADGITSTLILYETLDQLGADASYYLPHRLLDGYGPNADRYRQLIQDRNVAVILTCDNGIAGFEAIQVARDMGVDVLVTDHHEIQDKLPNANAIVHPQHPKGQYPFSDLAGAGVALKVAHALLGEVPAEALELAAIGTIADMVSVKDENRTIIKAGLALMKDTLRIGLELMLKQATDNLANVDEETIGFAVGPRLNAIGRLGDPTPGLELLATFDEDQAQSLLSFINQENDRRKALVADISRQVQERLSGLDSLPAIIIEAGQDWPAGVLGIVASKVTEVYHRPAIILEYQADKKIYKGSGRGIPGVHLFDWIQRNQAYTQHFGGHAQAAGLTIPEDRFDDFVKAMLESAQDFVDPNQADRPSLVIDLLLSIDEISQDLYKEIESLAPFGTDNPKPVLALEGVQLGQKRLIGAQKDHVKFTLKDSKVPSAQVEGIAFNKAALFDGVELMDLDTAFYIGLNQWQGQTSIQLRLEDLKVQGERIRDFRASKVNPEILKAQKALVLYQNPKLLAWLQKQMSPSNQFIHYQEVLEIHNFQENHLILMDPPKNLASLHHLWQLKRWEQIDLGLYHQSSVYLAGLPSRADFTAFYKWCRQHLHALSSQEVYRKAVPELKLPLEKIKCMLGVFFDLKFVTIGDGCASFVGPSNQEKADLTSAPTYQAFKAAYQAEALLLYQSPSQIKTYINELRK